MWLKLLKSESIGELLKPQLVNGRWRAPAINGRKKAELRSYFAKTGVPWIYEPETAEVDMNSPYNRKPKGNYVERNFEVRLASIRKALSTQEDRFTKYRTDKMVNRTLKGYDRVIAGTLKGMGQMDNEAKKNTKSSAVRAAETAALKELGIKTTQKRGSKGG